MIIAQVCLRGGAVRGGLKTSQYLVWPPFASRSATHLLHIELIRLLTVACGMLVHSSSMAVWSCWILAGTGTRGHIRRSRASQTCSIGDMSGECWPCKNWDVFSFQELCTDPCNMALCIIMLQHEVMVVDEWHNNGPQDLVTVSLCIQNAINKMHLCSLSITPPPPWATWSTTLTSANRSPTRRHTHCLPSALYSENRDSSVKRTPLQSARRHRMWVFAHSSRLRRRAAVRSRPWWGRRACRWASLRRFLTVCAEIIWLCKLIVAAAVRVAGLRRSWRWRCWRWRSWAGVVTHGLRLWGRLDLLQDSLKRLWRRLGDATVCSVYIYKKYIVVYLW